MTAKRLPRKTAFRAALIEAGMTVTAWAERNRVSRTHLYLVLEGDREPSAELAAKIEKVLDDRAA